MRKGICLLLVVLLCSGYGYSAKKSSKDNDTSLGTKSKSVLATTPTDAIGTTATVAKKDTSATTASTAPAAADIQGAAAAIKALSGGNPEEAKARLEAIKRVASAMAVKQQQQQK